MGLTPSDFLTQSRFEPVALAVLVAAAAWYALSVRRVRAGGREWPARRVWCFAGAWACVALAEFSGLYAFAPTNFSAYDGLFAAVGLVAPGLLALSAPLELALLAHPRRTRLLDSVPARVLGHPLVSWLAFTGTLFGLFFSGLLVDTMVDSLDQQLVFAGLIVVGYLYYWPVADVDPRPRRLGYWPRIMYMLAAFPVYVIIGMGIQSATTPLTPVLTLGSLHLGAAVLWVSGETAALYPAVAVFVQWLRADQRRAQAHDLAHREAADRQLALWRASRDAAARAAGPLH